MVMSKKSRPDAFAEGAKAKRYTRAAVALCALALMVAAGCGGGAGARAVHIRDA